MSTETAAIERKYFAADEVNFTPGERSFVAWVSTEQVDHEGDVVVASGVDFKSVYLDNPVVLAVHDMGTWPIGQTEWLKVKNGANWRGLYGKALIDDTPDNEIIWKKMQSRTVRGVSIGFKPPTDMKRGEWGPPTADEVARNPGWKGATRVIRRCVMFEFSVCPIGMNPGALIEAVSKGMHRPQYDEPAPVPEDEPVSVVVKAVDPEPDEDDPDEPEGPIRNGHYVKVTKGPHRGVAGKVKSVHRSGLVPDVEDDVPASKAAPGLRVNVYKAMGDGHKESSHHVGCKMADCERTDDLRPPGRKKGVDHAAAAGLDLDPSELRSDDDMRRERRLAVKAVVTSPAFLRDAVQAALHQITGAV